ncbi:hypothetical protein TNCV_1769531 [Trichonephila clavipes]|nr:hypothetical protein TNCV_1769531 [Trichonephila clavipes]
MEVVQLRVVLANSIQDSPIGVVSESKIRHECLQIKQCGCQKREISIRLIVTYVPTISNNNQQRDELRKRVRDTRKDATHIETSRKPNLEHEQYAALLTRT